ncbi:hypothetical protein HIM_07177 [Hirsutella minnesotensis 3608]|uniref:Magnesium transporter NIPA7 n=1 Tax=Hirsutella minnesotensis 3608 TaxID=1043627 RepID=A0A0F7ZTM7_9HYPO|nr:hypothetical protein HIM_07177 [Hirsutella minnesotensis 3608]
MQSPTVGPPAPTLSPIPENPGKTLQNWSSLIGIITAIVGNILIALALNVQRYAHTRLHRERVRVRRQARAALKRSQSSNQSGVYGSFGDEGNGTGRQANTAYQDDETLPLAASYHSSATADTETGDDEDNDKVASTYLKSPYWWLGQILITLGEMGNFLAYGFAPASIVSPLGVVALISNCIIAPVMFNEKFRARDFWGVVIAVGGVVTVVLSAKQEETKLEPHDVWEAITTLAFEIYMVITVLLILILMYMSGRYGKRTILIDLGLVGLFGGYTALATKGVSSMLSSTLWRAFTTPVTYVLIVILLATAVMQIRYVNKALQRFDSTQVIPIQFVLFTLCVIMGSAILYRDFEKTTAEQAGKFVGGCLLTFFGVFLITSGRQPQEEDEDMLSDAEGVEETIGLTRQEANGTDRVPDVPTPISQSRRSSRFSRVSFVEPPKPGSPPEESDAPVLFPPGGADQFRDGPDGDSSPLVENPWRDTVDHPVPIARGTRGLSTESVTTVPTVSASSFPPTPQRDSPAVHSLYPHGSERPVTPRTHTSSSRTSGHRRSKTFISPSPLSSTVTTVVKDAFLGRNDQRLGTKSSMKRIRSSIRASLFFNDEEDKDESDLGQVAVAGPVSDGHLPLTSSEQNTDMAADTDPNRSRSRSVSDALGDLFRSSKKKPSTVEEGTVSDAEASGHTAHLP